MDNDNNDNVPMQASFLRPFCCQRDEVKHDSLPAIPVTYGILHTDDHIVSSLEVIGDVICVLQCMPSFSI